MLERTWLKSQLFISILLIWCIYVLSRWSDFESGGMPCMSVFFAVTASTAPPSTMSSVLVMPVSEPAAYLRHRKDGLASPWACPGRVLRFQRFDCQ